MLLSQGTSLSALPSFIMCVSASNQDASVTSVETVLTKAPGVTVSECFSSDKFASTRESTVSVDEPGNRRSICAVLACGVPAEEALRDLCCDKLVAFSQTSRGSSGRRDVYEAILGGEDEHLGQHRNL